MAKEEKENKVEAETLENAFDEGGEIEDKPQKEGGEVLSDAEAVADAEIKAQEAKEAEAKKAETKEKEKLSEAPEKTWTELGHPRYEKMTREQIAAEISWRHEVDGRQSDELGDLRKKLKTQDGELEKFKKPPEEKVDFLESLPAMTEGEVMDFNSLYETNPMKAIMKYSSPHIKQIIESHLKETLPQYMQGTVGGLLAEQNEAGEYKKFLDSNDDAEEYVDAMKVLDKPENLGQQRRPYRDLYELAKLGTTQDSLYAPVFQMMRSYPNMPFAEAKKFVELQSHSPDSAKNTREKIKKDVNELQAAGSTTSKKSKASLEKATDVEEAFDSVKDED